MRFPLFYLLLLHCAVPHVATAGEMTFSWQGETGNCGVYCSWILADGEIASGKTTKNLEAFLNASSEPPLPGGHKIRRASTSSFILFNSPGGDLQESLALGRFIRHEGLNTMVEPRTYMWKGDPRVAEVREPHNQSAFCASACTYSFLGGINRSIAPSSPFEVHQFYVKESLNRPAEAQFSAVDMAAFQKLQGQLADYVREMGVDPGFVAIASQIPPWQPTHRLTLDEAVSLHVITTEQPNGHWSIEPVLGGVRANITQKQKSEYTTTLSIFCTPEKHVMALISATPGHILYAENTNKYDTGEIEISVDGRSIDRSFDIYSGIKYDENNDIASYYVRLLPNSITAMRRGKRINFDLSLPHVVSETFGITADFSLVGALENIDVALVNCLSPQRK